MTKFLVPFDFSEQAQNALDFATNLADKFEQVTIELIHVIEVPSTVQMGTMGGGDMMPDAQNQVFFMELMERRKLQFKELEAKYATKKYKFNTSIEMGNAFNGISEAIEGHNPNLVIMGSKGSSGFEEMMIGSNTEKVVRHSKCPVITIKSAVNPSDFKKVVFASDFNENDEELATRMKELQELLDIDLYLVIINTPNNFESTRESSKRIKNFANKYNIRHAVAEIYNSSSEEKGIVEFAEDINADMIAMSTHGNTGLKHFFSGSIAEDVVNHSKRPVWTFKVK
jgi:nucleotide-binding universal stress UspA family protein